jgi:hypothetical protein
MLHLDEPPEPESCSTTRADPAPPGHSIPIADPVVPAVQFNSVFTKRLLIAADRKAGLALRKDAYTFCRCKQS